MHTIAGGDEPIKCAYFVTGNTNNTLIDFTSLSVGNSKKYYLNLS